MFDLGELVKRAIKYLVEGLMVALAAFAIPKKSLQLDEVCLIALTAAATFSTVSYTHLRAHETRIHLVCRLLLEKNFF